MNYDIFLDANAHIPVSEKGIQAYIEFNKTIAAHGHPQSPSTIGRAACCALEDSRQKISKLIGAKSPAQIFFTSSCTQACEWASKILFEYKEASNDNVLVSTLEHPAMRDASRLFFQDLKKIQSNNDGSLDYEKLETYEKIIWIHLQNEIGTIYDLKKLKNKSKILLADMSQSLGKIPINVSDLDVDIAVFGAHKFGGFGNLGFIYLKDTSIWKSFGTGSRYFMDRPGTIDVASIVASAYALEEAIESLPERTKNMIEFRNVLEDGLTKLGFDIIGKSYERSPNTTFVKAPKRNALLIMKELGDNSIHVGLGSACGSMHTGDNPIMKSLGIPGGIEDFIRFSQWGYYKKEHAEKVLSIISNIQ